MADSKTVIYYQRIQDLIDANDILVSTDARVKNCERIARLCSVLGSYKDCAELKEKYENLAVEELEKGKERDYQKCLERVENAKTIDSYKRAEMLLDEIGDYKDARKLSEQCRAKRLKLLAKERLKTILVGLVAFAAIAALVVTVYVSNKGNPNQQKITVTNISRGIRLSWSLEESQDYYIYREIYNTKTGKWTEKTEIGHVIGSNYIDTSVYPGTMYRYAVIEGNGDNSEPSYYTTMIRITTREIISLDGVTSTSFKIRWSGSEVFTGYQIQYSSVEGSFAQAENIIVDTKDRYSLLIDGLAEGATYYVRVRSFQTYNGVTYYGGWSPTQGISLASSAD